MPSGIRVEDWGEHVAASYAEGMRRYAREVEAATLQIRLFAAELYARHVDAVQAMPWWQRSWHFWTGHRR